jgi:6-phosphogluconolactonase
MEKSSLNMRKQLATIIVGAFVKSSLVCCLFMASLHGEGYASWLQAETGSVRPGEAWVYVGTYSGPKSQGIYVFKLDLKSGVVTSMGLAAESKNPSFLAIHPGGSLLFAANETNEFNGKKSGAVSAFSIQPGNGKLTLLNQQASEGDGPCHLVVDRSGKFLLVANYGGGSVAVLPIGPQGRLDKAVSFIQHRGSSVNPQRQKEPHAHSINLDAGNRFAFVADLGLDQVLIYRFNAADGSLTPNKPSFVSVNPGAGPRHFSFHPNGRFAYVINEIQSTVTAFSYDAKGGNLQEVQTLSTLPPGFQGETDTAEIQVHPSGKFAYGSNRGHDSIAIFGIDEKTGRLTLLGNEPTQGKTPRNFGVDPTGQFLLAANQDSDSVVVFRIDQQTGRLKATGQTLQVGSPVCVKFLLKK